MFGGEKDIDPKKIPNSGRLDMGDLSNLSVEDFDPANSGLSYDSYSPASSKGGLEGSAKMPVVFQQSEIDSTQYRPVVEVEPFGTIKGHWRTGRVFEKEERKTFNMLIMNAISEFIWSVPQFNVQRKQHGFKFRDNPKFRKLEARDFNPDDVRDVEDEGDVMLQSQIPFIAFSEKDNEPKWCWLVDEIIAATFSEDGEDLDMPYSISISRFDDGHFTKKQTYTMVVEEQTEE